MGKNRKRKRQKQQIGVEVVVPVVEKPPLSTHDDDDDDTSIHEEDLEITVTTVNQLASNPERLSDKRFKALRKALHPLVVHQLSTSYRHGTDYRIKVSQYLSNQQWADALAALQGCRDFAQIPKQGTLQRWVRDVDLCTAPCKLQLLNAILQLSSAQDSSSSSQRDDDACDNAEISSMTDSTSLNRHDPRLAILKLQQSGAGSGSFEETSAAVNNKEGFLEIRDDWAPRDAVMSKCVDYDATLPTIQLHSKILYREAAAERTPPNHYDLLLHTTAKPGTIQWDDDSNANAKESQSPIRIQAHPVPFLQSQKGDAIVLQDVLTVEECQQLRAAATQLGWRPDHPTSLPQPTGIDSCEWLVDESILKVVRERVRPYIIQDLMTMTKNAVVGDSSAAITFHSINPRWRFFRYGPGCVYRPHIDGSWPASRIDQDGNYECYSTDKEDGCTIKSFHTFLIYLNDNFEGGQTRFYVPSSTGLAAHGVQPRCGSVLVFSQGNTASLIHEGSAVTSGYKYVVRTDVLYKVQKR